MTHTNTDIHSALNKCKYYEEEIMRDTYFRPWITGVFDLKDDQTCLDLETSSSMNKLKSSNDSLKQYYSPHGFEGGFPKFKNRSYETFGNPPSMCFKKILILLLITLIITFIIKYI
jgi:hypothetical protein